MPRLAASSAEDDRPKVGRPPLINRRMIAEAARSVGLEGLTLKAVADHLGVSVSALYHHVSGKDDLLRAAAEASLQAAPLPADTGQHWARWLLEWARYNHDVFLSQPALLDQYLDGAIPPEVIADRTDRILGLLLREGFTAGEAIAAYDLVASCAIGAVVSAIRESTAAGRGESTADAYRRLLSERPRDELTNLRQLIEARRQRPAPTFDDRIATLLAGIAARRGADVRDVMEAIAHADAPAGRRR